jgi:uncharacterized membrane protein YcaP (DUF421 family)
MNVDMIEVWNEALGAGLEAKDLTILQMAARAAVIYLATLAVVRLAKTRFLGRASAFDVVVGIIIGSIASRAITGNAPMAPSMAACLVIVLLHWLLSAAAVRSHRFGELIKGSSKMLVQDGRVDESAMRSAHMTQRDLEEALRQQGLADHREVAEARLERDGSLSVIKR